MERLHVYSEDQNLRINVRDAALLKVPDELLKGGETRLPQAM